MMISMMYFAISCPSNMSSCHVRLDVLQIDEIELYKYL
jgi:hypothetical protein